MNQIKKYLRIILIFSFVLFNSCYEYTVSDNYISDDRIIGKWILYLNDQNIIQFHSISKYNECYRDEMKAYDKTKQIISNIDYNICISDIHNTKILNVIENNEKSNIYILKYKTDSNNLEMNSFDGITFPSYMSNVDIKKLNKKEFREVFYNYFYNINWSKDSLNAEKASFFTSSIYDITEVKEGLNRKLDNTK